MRDSSLNFFTQSPTRFDLDPLRASSSVRLKFSSTPPWRIRNQAASWRRQFKFASRKLRPATPVLSGSHLARGAQKVPLGPPTSCARQRCPRAATGRHGRTPADTARRRDVRCSGFQANTLSISASRSEACAGITKLRPTAESTLNINRTDLISTATHVCGDVEFSSVLNSLLASSLSRPINLKRLQAGCLHEDGKR